MSIVIEIVKHQGVFVARRMDVMSIASTWPCNMSVMLRIAHLVNMDAPTELLLNFYVDAKDQMARRAINMKLASRLSRLLIEVMVSVAIGPSNLARSLLSILVKLSTRRSAIVA